MTKPPPYVIKDSGKRAEFESGMVRDVQDDKIDYALLFSGPMLKRWAEHLTKGAKKYDRDNWLKATGDAELQRFRQSAARHFFQWMNGETDEDHAAAVIFNINGAEYVKQRIGEGAPSARMLRCDSTYTSLTGTDQCEGEIGHLDNHAGGQFLW